MNAITQALNTIEKLQRERDDAKNAFRAAWERAEAAEKKCAAMEKILRDYALTDRVDFTNMRNEACIALGEPIRP